MYKAFGDLVRDLRELSAGSCRMTFNYRDHSMQACLHIHIDIQIRIHTYVRTCIPPGLRYDDNFIYVP